MTVRRLVAGYGAVMAIAVALYFQWPSVPYVTVSLVGLASAGAIVVGVRRYRPQHVRPWLLVAAALVLLATARVVVDLLPGQTGTLKPWVWTVWVLHLAMLVCLVGGLLGLARWRAQGIPALVDTAIILLGSGLLASILIAIPYASAPGIGSLWAGVRVAYVLRDVLVLGVAVHFVTAVRWSVSVLLTWLGVLSLVVYDVLFRRILGDYLFYTPIDLIWLLFFAAVGAAALVPSMAALGTPRSTSGSAGTSLRLGLVALTVFLPSGVLIAELFRLPPWYQPLVVAVATVVLALVVVRAVDVAARLRRQVGGERILRDAITDLAAASDAATVTAALDRAVRRLLPLGTDYRLLVAPPGLDRTGGGSGTVELRETATLAAGVAAQLGDGGVTLVMPLDRPRSQAALSGSTVDGGESADSDAGAGTLLVRADLAALGALRPRLDVLATQAAFALNQLRLHDEVVRHTSEEYFRTLVQNSTDVILIVDDENRIRYASPSADALFGATPVRGVWLPGLVDSADRDAAQRQLARTRAGPPDAPATDGDRAPAYCDWTVRAVGGDPVQVEVSCSDLRGDPSVRGLVVTLRNVTEQRRLERELTHRAFHDPLTEIGNRLLFTEELDAAVRDAADAEQVVAVLFIDLDNLKVINDSLGHEIGDDLLARMGGRLRTFVAANASTQRDLAARLGGDEFAVLLAGVADKEAADEAARRLVAVLGQPVEIAGHEVTCTASVGVATTTEEGDSSAESLRRADLALYAAKATGKGHWRRYEPWMRSTMMQRLELRSSLEHAIRHDALFLEYQPIVALDDGRPVGFEALLRWRHPTRGVLTPDTFIDIAEESGLISPIGEWVLATAAKAVQRWAVSPPDAPPYIAVNVSARQFRTEGFTSSIRRLLAEASLPPQRLLLEITESLLLRDDDNVWHDLQRLRRLGVRIAIDDFGTGYSALSYLQQVPLDVVKLDRMFIHNMTVSAQQRRLVEGIVSLTEVLGLHVVAEGIETGDELDLAKQAGCAYGQGYLFGRPMPADAVPGWLTAQPRERSGHDRTRSA
jgi:diguanylate cyclase (GGDEF)-like protein/PAS domain S-box-containing protein